MSNDYLSSMLAYNKYWDDKETKAQKLEMEREKMNNQITADSAVPSEQEVKQGFSGGFFNGLEAGTPAIAAGIRRKMRRRNNQKVLDYFNSIREQQDLLGQQAEAESSWLSNMAPAFKKQIMQISGLTAQQAKDVLKPFIDNYNQHVGTDAEITDVNPSNGNLYITDRTTGEGGVVNLYSMFPDLEASNVVQDSQNALFTAADMRRSIMQGMQQEQEDRDYKRQRDNYGFALREKSLRLQEEDLRDRIADRQETRAAREEERAYRRYTRSPEYLREQEYMKGVEHNRPNATKEFQTNSDDLYAIRAKAKAVAKIEQIRQKMVDIAGGENELGDLLTSNTEEAQKFREQITQPMTKDKIGMVLKAFTGKKTKEAIRYGLNATNALQQAFMKDLKRIYGANPSNRDLEAEKRNIPNIFQGKESFDENIANTYDDLQENKRYLLKKNKRLMPFTYYDREGDYNG